MENGVTLFELAAYPAAACLFACLPGFVTYYSSTSCNKWIPTLSLVLLLPMSRGGEVSDHFEFCAHIVSLLEVLLTPMKMALCFGFSCDGKHNRAQRLVRLTAINDNKQSFTVPKCLPKFNFNNFSLFLGLCLGLCLVKYRKRNEAKLIVVTKVGRSFYMALNKYNMQTK